MALGFVFRVMCGGVEPLMVLFPELNRITRDKEAFAASHLWLRNEVVHWELDFIRLIQDWELESVSNFLDILYSIPIKGKGRIKFVGNPQDQRSSKYALSIMLCLQRIVCDFRRNAFGNCKSA
jgi:hypothetical protein